ncbi:hypothetical protein I302_103483 [Kwoniella bestiolae CBS 10118]|uniref:Uncharacterized protein n=1 Tax=Kwoniella bestiolae CBS 10118 TaxID=1296100 RepID=A0A1B9G8L2_9TREE|nr:hypothetical protein I302_02184 [Kwoniella bestiolae CBS 10118]OCF27343.1 hypothetical protein I302_02184 [Kwoniella bestiolae CBS 10118]
MSYSVDYINYKVCLESEPAVTWQIGHTLSTSIATFLFSHPMRVLIDANSSEFSASPDTYSRLTVNMSIRAHSNQLHSIFKNRVTLPLCAVTPENRDGKWYEASSGGVGHGSYPTSDGPEFAQAVVASHLTEPFEIVRNNGQV